MTLEFDEERTDQYGRALAYVYKGEELFNETLVREGLGRVEIFQPNDRYERELRAAEDEARNEGIGIWAADPCTTAEQTTPEQTTPPPAPPEQTFPQPTPPQPTPQPSPPEPAPDPQPPVGGGERDSDDLRWGYFCGTSLLIRKLM